MVLLKVRSYGLPSSAQELDATRSIICKHGPSWASLASGSIQKKEAQNVVENHIHCWVSRSQPWDCHVGDSEGVRES